MSGWMGSCRAGRMFRWCSMSWITTKSTRSARSQNSPGRGSRSQRGLSSWPKRDARTSSSAPPATTPSTHGSQPQHSRSTHQRAVCSESCTHRSARGQLEKDPPNRTPRQRPTGTAACLLTVHRDRLPLSGDACRSPSGTRRRWRGLPAGGRQRTRRGLVAQLSVRWAAGQLPGGKAAWGTCRRVSVIRAVAICFRRRCSGAQRDRSNAIMTLVPWGPESVFTRSASFRTTHRP